MGLILLYNRGKGESEHLNKNIRMFEGFDIECRSFRLVPKAFLFSKADILYLNWYENIYNGSLFIALCQFLVKNLVLDAAKIKGIRIYASQHNRVQHDSKHPKLSKAMFRKIYKLSDKIIIFSEGAVEDLKIYISSDEAQRKAYWIPAVNYIGTYPYQKHQWISQLAADDWMTVLMVGSLNHPYKNVDMVISIAKKLEDRKIKFILAGKMASQEQVDVYKAKIKGWANIVGTFRFIMNDEMAQLIEVSDIIIMPYDVESVSNSGTARLAFSYGRTIICPFVPSIQGIPKELIYSYTYKNADDHSKNVQQCILAAYHEYCKDKNALKQKGTALKKIMKDNHSPEAVTQKYKKLFTGN